MTIMARSRAAGARHGTGAITKSLHLSHRQAAGREERGRERGRNQLVDSKDHCYSSWVARSAHVVGCLVMPALGAKCWT